MSERSEASREALVERVAMLEKIAAALMDRVERSVNSAGDAYALFESNVVMQRLIAERTRELEESNAALMEEVRIRRGAEEALRRAKDAAEEASRVKSDFLANMSHEIRTPMTAILGYADMALEERDDAEQVRAHMGVIKRNGTHLLAIINDILDLSKLEAGHMRAVESPACLADVARSVAEVLRVSADAKGLSLTVETDAGLPDRMLMDPARVRQILFNLVGNAIKFTQRGGVTVSLSHADGVAVLRVRDTGPGMSPETIARIFEPFRQGDDSVTRAHGGTGLGLSIARRLAQLLGGDISVESELGVGSEFVVRLRADRAGVGCREVEPDVTRAGDARPEAASASRPPCDPAPDEDTPGPLAGVRILLVEDGVDNQRLLSFILGRAGAEVEIAEDGQAALERVRDSGPFGLVLMDMQMPRMDGYAATRALRGMGCDTPVVALTAHAMLGDRERCLDAGCDDYLTKPVDRAALVGLCVRLANPGTREAA